MRPLDFFRLPEVMGLLERAALSAGTPLSLHFVERNQEGTRVLGWGSCAACRHVNAIREGRLSCRLSRTAAASAAAGQGRPIPFICHMGFACVSVPALPDSGFVLTFGPYCPAGEDQGLEYDARQGLSALLEDEVMVFPETLDDIHRAPAASVPAVADWTLDSLSRVWTECAAEETRAAETQETVEPPKTPDRPRKRKPTSPPHAFHYPAAEIAAALSRGEIPLARTLLKTALAEGKPRKRLKSAESRARVTAAVSAILEAATRAGLPAQEVGSLYQDMLTVLETAESEPEMLNTGMKVLAALGRKAKKRLTPKAGLEALEVLVADSLLDGVTLGEVAAKLGETPSAISHRLRRNYGMSFTEYTSRIRVDRAKELLRRTKLSATAIAGRVGVRDQSNFGKLFKKYEGMSPLDYRRKYGGGK